MERNTTVLKGTFVYFFMNILLKNSVWMDRPYLPSEVSSNIGRDWPDARGIWQNSDKTLNAFLNRKDHILLSVTDPGSNFKASFTKFYQFVKRVG